MTMATIRRGDSPSDGSIQPSTDAVTVHATGESLDVFNAELLAVPSAGTVAAPGGVPGAELLPPDRAAGESLPGTLQQELSPGDPRTDQFGLNLQQGAAQTGFYGDRTLALPDAPAAADMSKDSINRIDVGIDFSNLGSGGSIDGRTPDAFDGMGQGNAATGPADPGGMVSDGGGSKFTTSAPAWYEFNKTSKAESAVDAQIAGMAEGTKHNPYVAIQEGIVGSVVDVPVADTAEAAEATAPAAEEPLPPVQQTKQQWKFVGEDVPAGGHTDGGLPATTGTTTILEAWTNLFKDDLPPDHPDYAGGGGGASPPGSKTGDSITQSLLINLGGQRGGDVDPRGDGDVETGGAQLFDPKDSVVDPGPDSFASTFEADRSMLGGPMDHVQPELADE
jgi:hypothetical protein